jgi:hypothetical protein
MYSFIVAKAQNVTTISGNYTAFAMDNLDNIYLLSKTNQLKKLNSAGDSIAVFNDIKKWGEATLMDVSNPLNIVLYYKNFATIVLLDGMLNPKHTIDLRKKNMFRVSTVGLSFDGKIWVYDELDNALKKIDDNGEVILKTPDLRQVFGQPIAPIKIFDQNRLVYLYDPQQGIYVFDYYGTFKNRIAITGWNNLQITGKYIFGTDSTNFYNYEISVVTDTHTPIPVEYKQYYQMQKKNNYFYGLREEGLDIIK